MMKLRKTPMQFSRKRVFAWLALLVIVGTIGILAYVAHKIMLEPAVGTSVSSLPATTRSQPIELQQFDSPRFSFVHPISYMKQNVPPQANPNNLESHTFISSTMSSRVLTVTVSKLVSGKLEDDPSYLMRQQDPKKYTFKSVALKNEKVMVASSNDGQQYQQTAFWPHAGMLMTFTMSGTANNTAAMTAEYQDLIGTISWH